MSKGTKQSGPACPDESAHDGFSSVQRNGSAGNHGQPAGNHGGRKRLLTGGAVLLVVLGAVLATYWPALSAGALYMDDTFYLGNQDLRHPSLASVKKIFGEVLAPSIVKGYYQPLALVSTMVDFLDPVASNNLRPFHRTSLLLHLLNVALVVVLLYLLFGNWLISGLLGLLFGLHPLNVEVVLWIAERKAVLSTFFALWSILLYLLYTRQPDRTGGRTWKLFGASLFMYICAVLSKPTAVPLVALLAVIDYWPLKRLSRRTLLEKAPFLIVCCASAVVTVISQSRSFDEGRVEMMHGPYLPFVMAYSIGLYLFKTVWPAGLVSDYMLPRMFSLANPEVLVCVILTAAGIAAMAFSARRTHALLAGGLFFFIAISPSLGIVRFTSSVVSNRFIYLPMIGLLLPLAWALTRLWDTPRGILKTTGVRTILIGIGAALALGCAGTTRNYESQWRNTLKLLNYYLTQSPYDYKLHTRLGNEWVERGNYDSAVEEFTKAIQLNPGWAENHLNLGRALLTLGRFGEAQLAFSGALGLTPNDWRGHVLMAVTLSKMNDPEAGIRELETAARLAPTAAEVHCTMADILVRQGKRDEAVREYQKALRLDPRYRQAQSALDTIMSN